jgi:hypothetical protein
VRLTTARLSASGLSDCGRSMAAKPADRVSFASITANNLGTVRKLNSVLFPIKYSEKFYQDIQAPEVEDYCKLGACLRPIMIHLLLVCSFTRPVHAVYFNDVPVGTLPWIWWFDQSVWLN